MAIIVFEDFNNYGPLPGYMQIGAQFGGTVVISNNTALNYNNSAGSLKGVYPFPLGVGGGVYIFANIYPGDFTGWNATANIVHIKFYAKMPGTKWGCKFFKIFGEDLGTGVANTTFGTDYTGEDPGGLIQVIFGDGTDPNNDAQNSIRFDGGPDQPSVGRSYGSAVISTPMGKSWASTDWGTGWHLFEFYTKFNMGTTSGNEIPNGEIGVRIDGNTYLYATGLFNRNPANPPISRVGFFDQSQGLNPSTFELWYDNIELSQDPFNSAPSVISTPGYTGNTILTMSRVC